MFCDVIIDPGHQTNYKLLDDIMLELAGNLKIQQLQAILAERWKPYIEKSYETMCELSSRLGIHRPRTKFLDVQKANLTYRKHSKSQTKKTEILYIFFGIHTANVVQLAGKIAQRVQATAA